MSPLVTEKAINKSRKIEGATHGSFLGKAVLFVGVPLFAESVTYLLRENVFPAYLNFTQMIQALGPGILYFAILLFLISALMNTVCRIARVRLETLMPPVFLGLFLALSLNRLLPTEEGFAWPRILVFVVSAICAGVSFFVLNRKPAETKRLFFANLLYCLFGSFTLSHLFQFPLQNPPITLLIHLLVFAGLLLMPGKIVAGVIVFLCILFFPAKRTHVPKFAPPTHIATFQRVILVGIDGFSPVIAESLMSKGKLPALQQITEQGTAGQLHTLSVPFSPLIWNSIYTGTAPGQHGIMAFTFTSFWGGIPFLSLWLDNWTNSDWNHLLVHAMRKSGLVRTLTPARSNHRLQPALWNMVDQTGSESLVIGGWTTYPPEMIKGTFVSDYALTAVDQKQGTYYPVSKQIQELVEQSPSVSEWPESLRRYAAKDARAHELATNLIGTQSKTRFVYVYYSLVDAFGHHFGTQIERATTSDHSKSELTDLRMKVYQRFDRYIADYVKLMKEDTLLMICSDHGFHFDKRQHNYPVDGIILLIGKGVRAHTRIEAGVYNIAPTITYALGIAPYAGFADVPLKQAFNGIIPELPARKYSRGSHFLEMIHDDALEREKLEELKDLQYINR
jgi:predicted AlkP superfamily pyrophosphatase or phosphodiesterase